jgi:hypothetical protein
MKYVNEANLAFMSELYYHPQNLQAGTKKQVSELQREALTPVFCHINFCQRQAKGASAWLGS